MLLLIAIYPPGFDLSGFLILDQATGETVSGAGYSIKASSPLSARVNGLQAMDEDGSILFLRFDYLRYSLKKFKTVGRRSRCGGCKSKL